MVEEHLTGDKSNYHVATLVNDKMSANVLHWLPHPPESCTQSKVSKRCLFGENVESQKGQGPHDRSLSTFMIIERYFHVSFGLSVLFLHLQVPRDILWANTGAYFGTGEAPKLDLSLSVRPGTKCGDE